MGGGQGSVVRRGLPTHMRSLRVLTRGWGYGVVRGHMSAGPLKSQAGAPLDLAQLFKTVRPGEVADWPVVLDEGGRRYRLRLVAIKKSAATAQEPAPPRHTPRSPAPSPV